MDTFGVYEIRLSTELDVYDKAGNYVGKDNLRANVYTLDGIEDEFGNKRLLSIGQLLMAICLTRAAELEQKVVQKMESLASTAQMLEDLTKNDQAVADLINSLPSTYNLKGTFPLNDSSTRYFLPIYQNGQQVSSAETVHDAITILVDRYKIEISDTDDTTLLDVMTALEAKMDTLNSVSQTTLIDIQSLTSKRDDTYGLLTNVQKSLHQTMIGNVNNF